MAPRRGGSSSSGSSSSGSSSSGSSCDLDYPCSSTIELMYGHRYTSLYSSSEITGQIVLHAIWSLFLIFLLLRALRARAPTLMAAMSLFLFAFVLKSVRYGLLSGGIDVPYGYRFESSVVMLLERIGMVLLFAAAVPALQVGKIGKLGFWALLVAFTGLSLAYVVLDFIISKEAVDGYKDGGLWRWTDRDFGLTLNAKEVREAQTTALGGDHGLSPLYIESRMFDQGFDDWLRDRGNQIKIGVAMDFVGFALAVFVGAQSIISWVRGKYHFREFVIAAVAACGFFLTTMFRVVVETHYVLWNWPIVTDEDKWTDYDKLYNAASLTATSGLSVPDGWLEGYRMTVAGFPIVQAVLEPLGIVMACAGLVGLMIKRREAERIGMGKGKR